MSEKKTFNHYAEDLVNALSLVEGAKTKEEATAIVTNRTEALKQLLEEIRYQVSYGSINTYIPRPLLGRLTTIELEPDFTSTNYGSAYFHNGKETIRINALLILSYFYTKRSKIFSEFRKDGEEYLLDANEIFGEKVIGVVKDFVKSMNISFRNAFVTVFATIFHEVFHIVLQHVAENGIIKNYTEEKSETDFPLDFVALNFSLDIFINTSLLFSNILYVFLSHNPKIPQMNNSLSPSSLFSFIEDIYSNKIANRSEIALKSNTIVKEVNAAFGNLMIPRGFGVIPALDVEKYDDVESIVEEYNQLLNGNYAEKVGATLTAESTVTDGLFRMSDVELLEYVKQKIPSELGKLAHIVTQSAILKYGNRENAIALTTYVPVRDFIDNNKDILEKIYEEIKKGPEVIQDIYANFLDYFGDVIHKNISNDEKIKEFTNSLVALRMHVFQIFEWAFWFYIETFAGENVFSSATSDSNAPSNANVEKKLRQDALDIENIKEEISTTLQEEGGAGIGLFSLNSSREVSIKRKNVPTLNKLIRRFATIATLDDGNVRSFSKLSRRKLNYGNNTILLPGEVGTTVNDVAVIVDTSGSMSKNDISKMVSIIVGVMKNFPMANFHLLWNDADYVKETYKGWQYARVEKLLNERGVFGGGGSVFTSVFTDKSVEKADFVFFISDLYIVLDLSNIKRRFKLPPTLIIDVSSDEVIDNGFSVIRKSQMPKNIGAVKAISDVAIKTFYTTSKSFKI